MAQIDTSIYGNLLRPAPSAMDYANQYAQAEGQRQNLLMSRMKMDEYQRGVQEQNAIRSALTSLGANATPEQRANALMGTGTQTGYTMADSLLKSVGERDYKTAQTRKENSDADAKDFAVKKQKYEFGVQQLQGAPDVQTAVRMIQQGVNMGAWGMQEAQQSVQALQQAAQSGNPQALIDWKQNQLRTILAPKDLLPTVQTRNTGGSTDTLSIDPVTGQARVTGSVKNTASPDAVMSNQLGYARLGEEKRAHDMVDARTREATSASMSKPFEVTAPDGGKVLVQQDKQGNIRQVQGYAPKSADKPATESELTAAGYAARMTEATKLLDQFEKTGRSTYATQAAASVPLVGGALQNASMSADQQRYKQAADDWIRAKLRKESGAAIGKDEMAQEYITYFPQPGDTPQVVQQKRASREVATKAMLQAGGKAIKAPSAPAGWKIEEVK